MSIKFSTGLRDGMLGGSSLKNQLDGGVIRIYSGTVPATADADLGGATLLMTISDDASGGGINFDSGAVNGTLSKDPAQIWRGVAVATGNATFMRHTTSADGGAASASLPRIQAPINFGVGGGFFIGPTLLETGASRTVNFYNVTLPTL